jgi:molybdopterin molybdotransferase
MISVAEASSNIMDRVPDPTVEHIPIECSTGRLLMEPIYAERDMPPFDRVMMDGFAFRFQDQVPEQFKVSAIALAGHQTTELKQENCCIEVTTGSPLPVGCDTVVPVEDCLVDGSTVRLKADARFEKGKFIHARGSDGLAGRQVLAPGTRMGPPEQSVAATEGAMQLAVSAVPRICLVTTGDEIISDGSSLKPEQIRGSHRETLRSLFAVFPSLEFSSLHALDEEESLSGALKESLAPADILLVTGGVSRGRMDLVPRLLKQLGVEEVFHRVAQKPGKPLWFGKTGNKLVFGLPGNPISTMMCARRYVFPVLEKWMGSTSGCARRISVSGDVPIAGDLTRYVPVRRSQEGFEVDPFATSGSLHSLTGTAGFIEVSPEMPDSTQFNFYDWNSR